MSKTILLVLIGIVILGLVVFGVIFLSSKSQNQGQEEINNLSQTLPVQENQMSKTYFDESGFSFNYPDSISVSDITPNDSTYYTLLDLSKAGKSIKISVKDGSNYLPPSGSVLLGGVSLAGMSAKQYSYKSKANEDLFLTVAIDKNVIYTIEGPKDSDFWEEAQNTLVSSFSFGDKTQATSGSSETSNVIYEGEEIIE